MGKGIDNNYNRRLGRMELLQRDLDQLPDRYQPTEQEAKRFAALVRQIIEKYCLSDPIVGNFPLAKEREELRAAQSEVERLSALLAERNTELAQAKTDLAQEQERALAEAQTEKRKTADGKPKTEK